MTTWKLCDSSYLDQFRSSVKIHPRAPIFTSALLSPSEATGIFNFITAEDRHKFRSTVYNPDGTTREDTYFRDCYSYGWEAIAPYSKMLRARTNEFVKLAAEYYGMAEVNELMPLDPFQVLEYGPSGKFRSHADSHMFDAATGSWTIANERRKLSFVLALCNQVDDPVSLNEFSGGSLTFANLVNDTGECYKIKPSAGIAVCFPSNPVAMHEVIPVIKGKRISIVNWFDYK